MQLVSNYWLYEAGQCPGKTLHVALGIVMSGLINACDSLIELDPKYRQRFGYGLKEEYHSLGHLKQAGLIKLKLSRYVSETGEMYLTKGSKGGILLEVIDTSHISKDYNLPLNVVFNYK